MAGRGNVVLWLAGGYVLYCVLPVSSLFRSQTRINLGQPALKSQSALPDRITLSDFNQLQVGIHSKDVVQIFGRPGEAFTPKNPESGNTGEKVYAWKNADGSLYRVDFKNDRLTAKRQVRLQD